MLNKKNQKSNDTYLNSRFRQTSIFWQFEVEVDGIWDMCVDYRYTSL